MSKIYNKLSPYLLKPLKWVYKKIFFPVFKNIFEIVTTYLQNIGIYWLFRFMKRLSIKLNAV